MLEVQARSYAGVHARKFNWTESYSLLSSPSALLVLREKCMAFAKWLIARRGEETLDLLANSDTRAWRDGAYDSSLPANLILAPEDRVVIQDIQVVMPLGFVWFASGPIRYRNEDATEWIYCDGIDESGNPAVIPASARR